MYFTCEALTLHKNNTPDNNQYTCEKQVWGAANSVVAYIHLFISELPDDITFAIANENGVVVVLNLREPAEFAAFE